MFYRIAVIFAAAMALSGCISAAPGDAPRLEVPGGAVALDQQQIQGALVGNTAFEQRGSTKNGVNYNAKVFFDPGGVAKGRAWGAWGQLYDSASWSVEADGTMCRTWHRYWEPGKPGCFKVYQAGQQYYFMHQNGAGKDYVITILPGNQIEG